jgi:hypothetical protein
MPDEGTPGVDIDIDLDEDHIDGDGIGGREVMVPMRKRRIVAMKSPEQDGTCTFFK